jgi:hypothetical protein
MTGYFSSPFGFSVAIPNEDYPLAAMGFTPIVGPVTWSWNCDPYECIGEGTADILGGYALGDLFDGSTFHGWVLGGTFLEDEIIDLTTGQPYADTQIYNYTFSGLWTNGWSTSGDASADIEFNARPVSGYDITTYSTPEPETMVLAGAFLAAAYKRTRALMRSR